MNFDSVAPYLPSPVSAVIYYAQDGHLSTDVCKQTLVDTALAVAGYVVLSRYAGQCGLNLATAVLGASLIFPNAAKYGIATYFAVTNINAAVNARRDVPGLVTHLAIATICYITTTYKFDECMQKYFYKKLCKVI